MSLWHIKKGGWKNDSQKFADDSHFGRGVVGRELFFQIDGWLWELAIKLIFGELAPSTTPHAWGGLGVIAPMTVEIVHSYLGTCWFFSENRYQVPHQVPPLFFSPRFTPTVPIHFLYFFIFIVFSPRVPIIFFHFLVTCFHFFHIHSWCSELQGSLPELQVIFVIFLGHFFLFLEQPHQCGCNFRSSGVAYSWISATPGRQSHCCGVNLGVAGVARVLSVLVGS
jgi:hypothetical protein